VSETNNRNVMLVGFGFFHFFVGAATVQVFVIAWGIGRIATALEVLAGIAK
jgi:hypothetical protein